jgi:hypothetical protein
MNFMRGKEGSFIPPQIVNQTKTSVKFVQVFKSATPRIIYQTPWFFK